MLQGNFYTVLNSQSNGKSISVLLEINPDHPIFEGHFPQVPVVPGVCMMQMVKELVEDFIGQPLRLSKADHLKFLTIINPRENKMLQAEIVIIDRSIKGIHVTAVFFHLETVFFKFKGEFVTE